VYIRCGVGRRVQTRKVGLRTDLRFWTVHLGKGEEMINQKGGRGFW